ncbi:MAG: hypothetical protein Q8L87_07015 [Anaerolineales bacterium]|nr:hypothetical protein [Anaerolineales bacterium]
MKYIRFLIVFLFLSACAPAPTAEPTATASAPYRITAEENLYAPRTGDLGRQIADVTITSVNLSERFDLTPSRVVVRFLGSMPGVCNELRINVEPPDEEFRIFIEVYSLSDASLTCDRVFQQFEASIMLGTYSNGRYTIWVNDSLVGDFVTY